MTAGERYTETNSYNPDNYLHKSRPNKKPVKFIRNTAYEISFFFTKKKLPIILGKMTEIFYSWFRNLQTVSKEGI